MTTRVLETKSDIDMLASLLRARKLPCTVTVVHGRKRSTAQNRLNRLWMNEAAQQLGEYDAEGYRAFCKLHFGVPILRNENEAFREQYDAVVKPLSYEQKIEIMKEPIDLPITRLMTSGQEKRYLDDVWRHFTDLGVKLTEPGLEAE